MTPTEVLASRFHVEANQHAETQSKLAAKIEECEALKLRLAEVEKQASTTPPHIETPTMAKREER